MSYPQPAAPDRQLPRGHLLVLNRGFRRTLEANPMDGTKPPQLPEQPVDAVRAGLAALDHGLVGLGVPRSCHELSLQRALLRAAREGRSVLFIIEVASLPLDLASPP
jgi:hypothetical protein